MSSVKPSKSLQTSLASAISFGAVTLIMEMLVSLLFPDRPKSMSVTWLGCLAWTGIGLAYPSIERPLNRLIAIAAFSIYLIGNLNAVASYFHYGRHYLTNLTEANLVYVLFAAVLSIGLIIGERILPRLDNSANYSIRDANWNTVFLWGTLLFPFVWFADELVALGRVPILTGEWIVDDIYSLSYGRLYGYGVLLGASALLMWRKRQSASSTLLSISMSVLLAATMFIMVFDGKRVFLLMFLGALAAHEIAARPDSAFWRKIFGMGAVLIAMYIAVLYLRQGGLILTRTDPADMFSKVGVEYRDFAFMYTRFMPGALPGYDWAASALGGFGNRVMLALLGLNKNELVFSGSAYQIAVTIRSTFGIRIGLLPELWLHYGLVGSLILIPIGIFFTWVTRLVEQTRTEVGRVLACLTYGVVLLSLVNQTTAVTGYLSLLLYLWLLWRFLEAFRYVPSPQVRRT